MIADKGLLLLALVAVGPALAQNYGCYETESEYFTSLGLDDYMSSGKCTEWCKAKDLPIAAMTMRFECLCSKYLPIKKAKSDKDCDAGCAGYNEQCGSYSGLYMNVHYSGAAKKVSRRPEESSTSPAPKPTEAKDKPAESLPPKEVPKEEEKKEGPSKGAVAAAVVVSLLVAAAVAVGGFILFRRRQRQKIEEEYRRTLAARDFTKKPEMDHRLEPVMIHRRDSVGSIADNEDFSRRILKVTNPDG